MSRIHEAIRKAAGDRAKEVATPSPEDIFQLSYLLAESAKAPKEKKDPPAIRLRPEVSNEEWTPDKQRMLFVAGGADGAGREQFRSLRTRVTQFQKQNGVKVILVGSALPGEGKTFVSANLACALAVQHENKVMLVGCDLRRGGLATLLGARPEPGLAEYLKGEATAAEVVQSGMGGNLHFISSGSPISEPGELIGGSKFQELIRNLRLAYDWIIIDTPPAIQFSDAAVIADLCDGVLLVFNAGATPTKLAQRAVQVFKKSMVLGAVLNRCEEMAVPEKYYGAYYHSGSAR